MPTGFEARAGGRTTFAAAPSAPVQTTTGASGASSRAQVVGGEAIGGAEGGNYTAPGNVADGLGAFVGKFMEPAIARKEQAQFFKGYTEAQAGRALSELTDNGSPMTKVFGPSGFAKGAEYYTAQSRVDKWARDTLADVDNLKRLSPEELASHMAETSMSMMTGDPYADQQIQVGLLENQGPIIQTITKVRFGWQQDNMVNSMSEAGENSASLLQEVAASNATLGEKADNEAVTVSAQRFLGSMAKPEGMTDESYQKFMYGFMRKSMQDGNFYGVELLRSRGVNDVLTEAQAKQVDDDYVKYGRRAQAQALSNPVIMSDLMKIDGQIALTEMGAPGGVTVEEVLQSYRALNVKLRQVSGVNEDYFSTENMQAGGGRVIDAIVSRYKQDQAKAEAAADRAATMDAARLAKEGEAEARIAGARAAWMTGDVTAAIAGGMVASDFNTIAMEEYSNGGISGISKAFVQSGWTSASVASQMQSKARAGLGEKYTEATGQAYTTWKNLDKANPALAAAYFGDYSLPFANFDRMVSGGISREVAYRDAFADVGQYSTQAIPPAQRKEAGEQLTSLISNKSFSWKNPLKWGNYTLTGTSQRELFRATTDDYARLSANSSRSPEEIAEQAYTAATNSGRFEQYGVYGWRNTRGGPTIGSQLKLRPKDANTVVMTAINYKLNAIGIRDPEGVRVIRTDNDLTLEYLENGVTKYQHVPFSYMQAVAQKHVEGKLNSNRVDPTTNSNKAMTGLLPFSL